MVGFRDPATIEQVGEWIHAARAWVATECLPLRSWRRQIPLPNRPLVATAAATAAGVALARWATVPGRAALAVAAWWIIAAVLLVAWQRLSARGLGPAAGVALLAAVACTAAAWSTARWSLFTADDLAWSLGDSPAPVAIEGVVVESPRTHRDASPSPRLAGPTLPPVVEYVVDVSRVRDGAAWRPASGRAAVTVTGTAVAVGVGDRVVVFGRGMRPPPAENPGDVDLQDEARASRCLSVVRVRDPAAMRVMEPADAVAVGAAIGRLRDRASAVLESCIAPRRAGLAAALLIGDRGSLPREEALLFVVTGTVHILSISGLHVSILAYAIGRLLRLAPIRRRWTVLASLVITGGYLLLVGPQTPVVRATIVVWMACCAALAGRRTQAMTALAAAAIVVLVWQPAELFRTGAQLSFLSTAVLVAVAEMLGRRESQDDPIARLIERSRSPLERRLRRVATEAWHLFVAGVAVWAVTAPIAAARFHVVSPVAVLINPLIAPLVAAAMGWGFLCLAAAPVSLAVATACGWACDASLGGTVWLVEIAAALPGGYAWVAGPPAWWVAGWYGWLTAAAVGLSAERLRRPLTWGLVAGCWACVGLAGEAVTALAAPPSPQLRAVVAAMGHGCGIVVRTASGRCLVYDAGRLGGPGAARRAMTGVLWDEGIGRIDSLVISHADADHFNAVPDLMERFSIGEIVVSEAFLRRDTAAVGELLLLARQSRIPVRAVAAGDSFPLDRSCRVRVLHAGAQRSRPGREIPDNETSVVLGIESAGRRLLLTGDLEGESLRRFVAAGPDSCDVLVAPHHGSASSLPPDIARATEAEWVIVSGEGGRRWREVERAYATARGHAAPATVLKTGGGGAIRLDLAVHDVAVEQFAEGAWRKVQRPRP